MSDIFHAILDYMSEFGILFVIACIIVYLLEKDENGE